MKKNFVLGLVIALLAVSPVLSQGIPTGTLTGRATSGGEPMPGVTVTVTSPALQGARTTTTSAIGDYNVPLLPPGDYNVTFELEGFQRIERTVKVNASSLNRADADMSLSTVSEEIVVTGSYETISTGTAASTTFEKEFVESLPVDRNIRETVLLTPGVAAGGPGGGRNRGITISGAQSYENLFLVNGVVVNENLRGQPFNLFIEDAIQETTVTTSGVSAEFGRFSGGVVNTITKSGGNELSGSFRTNFTNQDWESPTPETISQVDDINQRYEGTLGGWVIKDRLWYFLAGRDFGEESVGQTTGPRDFIRSPYDIVNEERRYEGKLTISPFQGHRLIGSYIEIDREEQGNVFGSILDLNSVVNRQLPQTLAALNYSGVITDNFFIEAQYSEREFTFENSGSIFTDRIRGTLLVDDEGFRWNSPTFCGVCTPENRNNENLLGKASWFVSTDSLGSHDLAFGYDTFNDIRKANNHQSGSDFRIFLTDTLQLANGELRPVALGNNSTFIVWNPIFVESEGTEFKTNSFFVNDRWRLNEHWSFNLGVRYDENDGVNSEGQTVANDSKISPRIGASYDLRGDGEWIINASAGEYVAALANTQGDATSRGGNPAQFVFLYQGPDITGNLPTAQALQTLFDWFDSVGGTSNQSVLSSVSIPGGTTIIPDTLVSPSVREVSLGVSKRLGTRGVFRAEAIHRDGMDFYVDRLDRTTGVGTLPTGGTANLSIIENRDDVLERTYDGLHTQAQYRAWDRLNIGGSYALSRSEGNVDGETAGSGPVRSAVLNYPEYKDPRWNNPKGALNNDATHRARLWAVYDLWKNQNNQLSVGLLQNFTSGTPYGAVGAVDTRIDVNGNNGIANPGYLRPPTSVTYYFTDRDEFRTDDITSTDLTLNYSFSWNALGKDIEIYVQPEVLNVFDEQNAVSVNQTVRDFTTLRANGSLQRFNPFTETPVEGVHWTKGTSFGRPLAEGDYQQPRTFRFSVGFRF